MPTWMRVNDDSIQPSEDGASTCAQDVFGMPPVAFTAFGPDATSVPGGMDFSACDFAQAPVCNFAPAFPGAVTAIAEPRRAPAATARPPTRAAAPRSPRTCPRNPPVRPPSPAVVHNPPPACLGSAAATVRLPPPPSSPATCNQHIHRRQQQPAVASIMNRTLHVRTVESIYD